jgi:hypothetical protein
MKTENIDVTELKVGDKFASEYGDDGNFAICEVLSIEEATEWYLQGKYKVTFRYENGIDDRVFTTVAKTGYPRNRFDRVVA